jgi:hypothetical protein
LEDRVPWRARSVREGIYLPGGLLVVAELAERHDAFLHGKSRQFREHRLGKRLVVGFLWIEPDAAIVMDTELAGAKSFEAEDRRQVVEIAADIGARLAEPERRLDDREHAGSRHCIIVVGAARDHVGVGIDEHRPRRGGNDELGDFGCIDAGEPNALRLFSAAPQLGQQKPKSAWNGTPASSSTRPAIFESRYNDAVLKLSLGNIIKTSSLSPYMQLNIG